MAEFFFTCDYRVYCRDKRNLWLLKKNYYTNKLALIQSQISKFCKGLTHHCWSTKSGHLIFHFSCFFFTSLIVLRIYFGSRSILMNFTQHPKSSNSTMNRKLILTNMSFFFSLVFFTFYLFPNKQIP